MHQLYFLLLVSIQFHQFWILCRCSVKLMCCFDIGSVRNACCLLKFIRFVFNFRWSMDNPINNWMCYHLLEQLHFFDVLLYSVGVLMNYDVLLLCLTSWSKQFRPLLKTLKPFISTDTRKYPVWFALCAFVSNNNTKALLTPMELKSSSLCTGFKFVMLHSIAIYSS